MHLAHVCSSLFAHRLVLSASTLTFDIIFCTLHLIRVLFRSFLALLPKVMLCKRYLMLCIFYGTADVYSAVLVRTLWCVHF